MKDYDEADPEQYERMYGMIPREIYMKEHWGPLIEESIEKYYKDVNVLDLGCGTGIYTMTIKKYADNFLGLDISKRWLNYLKNKRNISNIIRADAHNIPLDNESFDAIVTIGLFEYINRNIVIKEMNRILKPDGFALFSFPNKYSAGGMVSKLICKVFRREYGPNEPSKREMFKLFENNGFQLIEYKMDDGLIWLPNFLDRLFGKRIYYLVENFFKIFGENPFSNVMLFVVRKT
jgi:ubiquinone/menaquinone biosynthesis C-methylase UbiE